MIKTTNKQIKKKTKIKKIKVNSNILINNNNSEYNDWLIDDSGG